MTGSRGAVWFGYLAAFAAGVVVTAGSFEAFELYSNATALFDGPRRVDVAAPPGEILEARVDPAVATSVKDKIATLTPAEKQALKERRRARHQTRRRSQHGKHGGASATTSASPSPADDDTGLDNAAP